MNNIFLREFIQPTINNENSKKEKIITFFPGGCFYGGGAECSKCSVYVNNRCTVHDEQ